MVSLPACYFGGKSYGVAGTSLRSDWGRGVSAGFTAGPTLVD